MKAIRAEGTPELDRDALLASAGNGCSAPAGKKGYIREVDRASALELAVNISRPGDIIVAAGKGHETYQITNAGTIHFDDAEHLAGALARLATPHDWSVHDLEQALKTPPAPACDTPGNHVFDLRFSTIGTDSRTIQPDMVFLALTGENFDGHDFVPILADQGIKAFVVKKGFVAGLGKNKGSNGLLTPKGLIFFEVDNTLAALGELAHFHRQRAGRQACGHHRFQRQNHHPENDPGYLCTTR